LILVLIIASNSKDDVKYDALLKVCFNEIFKNSDILSKNTVYTFLLKLHIAVIDYSFIVGHNSEIKSAKDRKQYYSDFEIKKTVIAIIEKIFGN
jgi:hypothetical protein